MIFFRKYRIKRVTRKLQTEERHLAELRAERCPLSQVGIATIQGTIDQLIKKLDHLCGLSA